MFKNNLIITVLFFYLFLSLKSYSGDTINDSSITYGTNEAGVKIKIFSSLTCPHCADFHIKVVPKIIKNYVDSGKVQLIFIDFPLDQAAFNASKTLHCIEKEKQMTFLDNVYEKQAKWANGSNIDEINKNLEKIVENLGISSTKFKNCLIDEVISDKILNGRIQASKKYSVNSTPTIIINEKKLEGSANFENIKKKIEKLI